MNRSSTFAEILDAFLRYLKEPKTCWDIKDYSLGCLTIIGGLLLITWLAVVLSTAN